jgi:DTW domain-containing protein YfiP
MTLHAVARLRAESLAHSPTRPRLDRGEPRKERCADCRLIPSHCMCALRPVVPTRAGFCVLMAEFEALKPSNTAWLIADVVPDTVAFAWSRTEVQPALLALLADPQWRPVVVFPGEFAEAARVITVLDADRDPFDPGTAGLTAPASTTAATGPTTTPATAPRPLFILLDGTWSEARKIFRKSPYLNALPVLSLHPEQLSRYRLRRSSHAHHFCTSEVAALCLALAGELHAAHTLEAYLDVFSHRYLQARQSLPADGDDAAHQRLRGLALAHAVR